MKRYIFFTILYFLTYFTSVESRALDTSVHLSKEEDDRGLFLTDYILQGKVKEGVEKARVRLPDFQNVESYSGYLTINKEYNSNTFFWFFPSQTNPASDPVMIWMIGGPGISILQSIFSYNGPLEVKADQTKNVRKECYATNHSILYIDNPIGSGFSFTDNEAGFARNATTTATDVLEAIKQFFQLFPDYKKNKFIVGGDSYAGKFVVTVADAIHEYNKIEKTNAINLGGLVIGNGIIQPHQQTAKADFLYQAGLFDENQRDQFKKIEVNPSGQSKLLEELFQNFTGFDFNENLLIASRPNQMLYFDYIVDNETRKALHVGSHEFRFKNSTVLNLTTDKGQAVTPTVEKLLEEYRILFYHGQLDLHVPYRSTINVYKNFSWSGAEVYKNAERRKIYYNEDLAGYWKVADNLNDVLVRNAGHVASYEQLLWCSKILTEFTHSD